MPLQGTLDAFSLDEVLEWLAHARKTGALKVDQPDHVGGVIYFAGGRFCGAEAGELTGKVDAPEELEARIIDVCFALLRVDGGSFDFEPDRLPSWPVGAGIDVVPVLDHVRGLVRDWSAIEGVIPSPNARPVLARNLNRESLTLERDTWSVVTAVDGHKNVREIARMLGRSVLDVSGVLKGLVESGAADMVGERHAGAPPVTDHPIVSHDEPPLVPAVSVELPPDEVTVDDPPAAELADATQESVAASTPRSDVTPFTMEELRAAQAEAQRSVEGEPGPGDARVGSGELAASPLIEAGAEAAALVGGTVPHGAPQGDSSSPATPDAEGAVPGRTVLAEALATGALSGGRPPGDQTVGPTAPAGGPDEESDVSDGASSGEGDGPREAVEDEVVEKVEQEAKSEPKKEAGPSRDPKPLSARDRGEALRMFSSLRRS